MQWNLINSLSAKLIVILIEKDFTKQTKQNRGKYIFIIALIGFYKFLYNEKQRKCTRRYAGDHKCCYTL
ncbi:Hypothetical predicted protein [Octopus vulgaris]|uniref:Uncharacterized protein n=1 Tax=Octopus vulgaris TaxID=6645 RepID=A0AA36BKT2_OCTVU|nr:Hypothetical predicted protein [Octopus vulgaris]